MRRTFLAACWLTAACAPLPMAAQVEPTGDEGLPRLHRELERISGDIDGVVGVAAHHVESGRKVFLNADERYPMASTYKVPIAVQLLTRIDRGELTLRDMVDLEPEDLHPGSGTITRLFDDPGVSLSVHNLLELMLLISDNSATDLSLRLAGGPDAVNARMQELGVTDLRVDRPTSVMISDYVGVDAPPDGRIGISEYRERSRALTDEEREAARRRFAEDAKDTSTPRAMASLLEEIWAGRALSPQSTTLLLDVLLRVETGRGRLRGMLPPGHRVGHKTGTVGGTTNDVGYIYLPDNAGHVITVVFVKDSERPTNERERVIAQLARAVHDFFLFNPGT